MEITFDELTNISEQNKLVWSDYFLNKAKYDEKLKQNLSKEEYRKFIYYILNFPYSVYLIDVENMKTFFSKKDNEEYVRIELDLYQLYIFFKNLTFKKIDPINRKVILNDYIVDKHLSSNKSLVKICNNLITKNDRFKQYYKQKFNFENFKAFIFNELTFYENLYEYFNTYGHILTRNIKTEYIVYRGININTQMKEKLSYKVKGLTSISTSINTALSFTKYYLPYNNYIDKYIFKIILPYGTKLVPLNLCNNEQWLEEFVLVSQGVLKPLKEEIVLIQTHKKTISVKLILCYFNITSQDLPQRKFFIDEEPTEQTFELFKKRKN